MVDIKHQGSQTQKGKKQLGNRFIGARKLLPSSHSDIRTHDLGLAWIHRNHRTLGPTIGQLVHV